MYQSMFGYQGENALAYDMCILDEMKIEEEQKKHAKNKNYICENNTDDQPKRIRKMLRKTTR